MIRFGSIGSISNWDFPEGIGSIGNYLSLGSLAPGEFGSIGTYWDLLGSIGSIGTYWDFPEGAGSIGSIGIYWDFSGWDFPPKVVDQNA